MEGLPADQKVDGLLAAHNVDGSLRKVFQLHRNLAEDNGRSSGCT